MTTMTMGRAPHAPSARPGALAGENGERIALQEVELHAALRDLLCEVRAVQVYRNDERRNIEAVYTFPLPMDAVLLGVQVTLGARVLAGVVVEKQGAEARYEEAVAEGDGAVMLEMAEPGLYTMNVGNLLPGEVARIETRYALLHRWTGDRLRLHFPTTIAPRYGAMPLPPHQLPEHSLVVEHHFAFSLTVHGALREGQFTCPTHALVQGERDGAMVLSLRRERAVMDRDVVIDLKAPRSARSALLAGNDGEGTAAIASFQPFLGGLQLTEPLSLAIVVDCSGSMAGDSIQQAKHALRDILAQLRPGDRIGIVAFGSHTQLLRPRLVPCSPAALQQAQHFCDALEANMGGTEIGAALDAAHHLLADTEGGNVFLITDGQVGAWEPIVAASRSTGHRHFTVGVGSAVSEAFVRSLADRTGGAAELVSPQEGMSERIVRHFDRLRSARAKAVRVTWPDGALDVVPASFGAIFDGDTLVASARFAQRVRAGEVVLEVETDDGRLNRQALQLSEAVADGSPADAVHHSTVARLAAAGRLPALAGDDARAVAVRYQLASPWTNWLVIAERGEGEKAQDMPALRKVPQTLAAGWGGVGGVGSVARASLRLSMVPAMAPPSASFARSMLDARPVTPKAPTHGTPVQFVENIELPTFGREGGGDGETVDVSRRRVGSAEEELRQRLVGLVNRDPSLVAPGRLLRLFELLGLDEVVAMLLHPPLPDGVTEEDFVAAFLLVVIDRLAPRGLNRDGAHAIRQLRVRVEGVRPAIEGAGDASARLDACAERVFVQ